MNLNHETHEIHEKAEEGPSSVFFVYFVCFVVQTRLKACRAATTMVRAAAAVSANAVR
jgi:hypothetical protein